MTQEQKKQVRDALIRYASCFPTIEAAALNMDNIDAQSITAIKNFDFSAVTDELWLAIAKQVGFYTGDHVAADTNNYLMLHALFNDAMLCARQYWLCSSSGSGKTFAASHFLRDRSNVYYLNGSSTFNMRTFLVALSTSCGIPVGNVAAAHLADFLSAVEDKNDPLIIIDDAHLLKDRVLQLLISLSFRLAAKAGMVVMGNETLFQRIAQGAENNKPGFADLLALAGSSYIKLHQVNLSDISLICMANGIDHTELITFIARQCNGDLHRVSSFIHSQHELTLAA